MVQPPWKTVWWFPAKQNIETLTIKSSNRAKYLPIGTEDISTQKPACECFKEVLFIISKTWKQLIHLQ